MDIHVFSDARNIEKCFPGMGGRSEHRIAVRPAAELKKFLAGPARGCFIYVDISSFKSAERQRVIKSLAKVDHLIYGFIDPKGEVEDAAGLFHEGASDYIGKELFKKGVPLKRFARVVDFRSAVAGEDEEGGAPVCEYILSGGKWEDIRPGNEYTFCFMYIELDKSKASKKTFGDGAMDNPLEPFVNFVERGITPAGGKIWMWNDFGGLILFPFDGKRIDAILACFRMILSRKIFSIEESGFNSLVSYRIVLHLGNTIYRGKGETGTIISDSINSTFHLVHKFAEPGNFYLTREVFEYSPAPLKQMFVPAGSFEGREIMRMRNPL